MAGAGKGCPLSLEAAQEHQPQCCISSLAGCPQAHAAWWGRCTRLGCRARVPTHLQPSLLGQQRGVHQGHVLLCPSSQHARSHSGCQVAASLLQGCPWGAGRRCAWASSREVRPAVEWPAWGWSFHPPIHPCTLQGSSPTVLHLLVYLLSCLPIGVPTPRLTKGADLQAALHLLAHRAQHSAQGPGQGDPGLGLG